MISGPGSPPNALGARNFGLETGTTRIAGYLPSLESASVTWQAGQYQPDALAALVVAHDDVLVHSAGHYPYRQPAYNLARCRAPGPGGHLAAARLDDAADRRLAGWDSRSYRPRSSSQSPSSS